MITAYDVEIEQFRPTFGEESGDLPELVEAASTLAEGSPRPIDVPDASGSTTANDTTVFNRRLAELPQELGVLLASVGVLGVILPGIAGTPTLIAGGLVLWPKTFNKVENWFEGRFPVAHRKSMEQVGRFLDDLERRYPTGEQRQA